ncbi:hypothetical protein CDAR_76441 [Caerostris darwini]|uniref:Uncharacterized protein n=1 Tax=Caerostris darwini TaxID=1538125 RepID=A0AAV4QEP2_9ARAC|nr:hypothetical protein CDAR_76441 [Caerostris darwini]
MPKNKETLMIVKLPNWRESAKFCQPRFLTGAAPRKRRRGAFAPGSCLLELLPKNEKGSDRERPADSPPDDERKKKKKEENKKKKSSFSPGVGA